MRGAEAIALGYVYPNPNSIPKLVAALESEMTAAAHRHMAQFVSEVSDLSLGEWEELHTATLDLSPQFIPYVGHIIWGDNYRRGAFMADLVVAMREANIDLGGELPDHIEPLLRYLAVEPEPLEDLLEVLHKAVLTMQDTLRKASPKNPYNHLLAATMAMVPDFKPLTIGVRK
jgi:nitrate reductase delta subunit